VRRAASKTERGGEGEADRWARRGIFLFFYFFLWAVTGPALDTVELSDPDMQTLPEYLSGLTPRIMRLKRCHQKLRDLLSLLPSMPSSAQLEYRAEMDKIKHCGKLVVL